MQSVSPSWSIGNLGETSLACRPYQGEHHQNYRHAYAQGRGEPVPIPVGYQVRFKWGRDWTGIVSEGQCLPIFTLSADREPRFCEEAYSMEYDSTIFEHGSHVHSPLQQLAEVLRKQGTRGRSGQLSGVSLWCLGVSHSGIKDPCSKELLSKRYCDWTKHRHFSPCLPKPVKWKEQILSSCRLMIPILLHGTSLKKVWYLTRSFLGADAPTIMPLRSSRLQSYAAPETAVEAMDEQVPGTRYIYGRLMPPKLQNLFRTKVI